LQCIIFWQRGKLINNFIYKGRGVNLLDLLLSLGWGTVSMTWEKAESLVQKLVSKGDIKKEDTKKMIKLQVSHGGKNRGYYIFLVVLARLLFP
jgi:hypothetical protein